MLKHNSAIVGAAVILLVGYGASSANVREYFVKHHVLRPQCNDRITKDSLLSQLISASGTQDALKYLQSHSEDVVFISNINIVENNSSTDTYQCKANISFRVPETAATRIATEIQNRLSDYNKAAAEYNNATAPSFGGFISVLTPQIASNFARAEKRKDYVESIKITKINNALFNVSTSFIYKVQESQDGYRNVEIFTDNGGQNAADLTRDVLFYTATFEQEEN